MDSGYKNRYRALPGKDDPKGIDKKKEGRLNNPSCHSEEISKTPEDANTDYSYPENERKKPGRKKGTKDSYKRKRRTKAEIESASKR